MTKKKWKITFWTSWIPVTLCYGLSIWYIFRISATWLAEGMLIDGKLVFLPGDGTWFIEKWFIYCLLPITFFFILQSLLAIHVFRQDESTKDKGWMIAFCSSFIPASICYGTLFWHNLLVEEGDVILPIGFFFILQVVLGISAFKAWRFIKDLFLSSGWRIAFWLISIPAGYCYYVVICSWFVWEDAILFLCFILPSIPLFILQVLFGFFAFAVSREPTEENVVFREPAEQKVEGRREKVEEDIDTYKYGKDECPRCSSILVSKTIIEGPLSEKEMNTYGYYYKWECQCSDCGTKWFEID